MTRFLPHGDYRVGKDGNIILFQAFGTWNKESSLLCTRHIRDLVLSFSGSEFALLIDSLDFEGVANEGYSDWFQAIQFWMDTNLKSVVRIDNANRSQYKIFLTQFDILFSENTDFHLTTSYSDALNYIWNMGHTGFESGLLDVPAVSSVDPKASFRVL